ncbi:hypothetical protein [Algicola sagamiensis]|uniref:hypothetical protein n=1 Tax=Algicola sagamiensis TaxID=163869 RepID=UPI000374EA71|nr:hypothetical protein [Algicola sagamiensis]
MKPYFYIMCAFSAGTLFSNPTIADPFHKKSDQGIAALMQAGWYQDSRETNTWKIPGFIVPGNAGPHDEGFNLMHAEIAFAAYRPGLGSGKFVIGKHADENLTIEEFWASPELPWEQLQLKVGRWYAPIGWHNGVHPHKWRFIDASLSQQAFLGEHFNDVGLLLTWADHFHRVNFWATGGDDFPAKSAKDSSTPAAGGLSYFGHQHITDVDIHFQTSLSYFRADERSNLDVEHTHNQLQKEIIFSGDSYLWTAGMDVQYHQFGWQFEYAYRDESGELRDVQQIKALYESQSDGWWHELYWKGNSMGAAIRYEQLASDNKLKTDNLSTFSEFMFSNGHEPSRISAMFNWQFQHGQDLKLQLTHDQTTENTENQIWLVYQATLDIGKF